MKENRTYAHRAEYLKKAVHKRRKRIRAKALQMKGNACEVCGYHRCSAALDFHHRDPQSKEFGISAHGLTRAWKKVEAEIAKCILLCANCHREVHSGITQLPEETQE